MKKITLMIAMGISMLMSGQFVEDFNDPAGVFPPAGWAVYDGANGLGTVEQWEQGGTAPNFRAFNLWEAVAPGQVAEDWIVSPLISIDATQNLLTFDATDFNQGDFGSQLSIRVSTTSQTAQASFVEVDNFDESELGNNATAAFSSFEVDLSGYLNQSVYIAFVHVQNDGDAVTFDNVEVGAAPTCAVPSDFVLNNPTTQTTIDLGWTNNQGPGATFEIEYGLIGFTQGTGTTLTSMTPDVFVDMLSPNSVYSFYIRTVCSATDFSDWIGPLNVRTLRDCTNAGMLPYATDFSGPEGGDCLTTEDADNASPAWQYNTANDLDGDGTNDNLMLIPASATESSKDDYLFGPGLNLTAGTTYTFTFTYNSLVNATPLGTENNSVRFLVSDAPTSSANTTLLGNNPTVTQQGTFGDTSGNDLISQAYVSTYSYTPTANETIYPTVHVDTAINGENTWFLLFGMQVTSTASVDDQVLNDMTLSPNPATDRFLLETNELIDSIAVYNMLGQNVEVTFNPNSNEVNISNLKSGTYFIKASSNGSSKTMKFVKN